MLLLRLDSACRKPIYHFFSCGEEFCFLKRILEPIACYLSGLMLISWKIGTRSAFSLNRSIMIVSKNLLVWFDCCARILVQKNHVSYFACFCICSLCVVIDVNQTDPNNWISSCKFVERWFKTGVFKLMMYHCACAQ